MRLDRDVAMQIAGRGAHFARLTFAGNANGLAFMNTGGDLYRDRFMADLPAGSMTGRALIFDYAAAPPAIGAGRDHAEHATKALLGDASLPATLHADDRLAAGFCASAFAGVAGVLLIELDSLLGADSYFIERHFDLCFQIEAALRATATAAATALPAERAAKDVVEHREDVADVHMREIMLTGDARMAKLVVALPL